jgi:elongation factor P--beta-lysine ligase
LEKLLEARAERKHAKKQVRATIRATKKRDTLIDQQEAAAASALCNREAFAQKRKAFDLLTNHMSEIHDKQKTSQSHKSANFNMRKLLRSLNHAILKLNARYRDEGSVGTKDSA